MPFSRFFIMAASFVLASHSIAPADPAWWAERGVKTTAPAANLAPANIGQAKHMAAMALAELQDKLSPTDSQTLRADLAAIVDLNVPDPKPADWAQKQRAPLLNGQLKAIAKPFYDCLRTHDVAWLDSAMQAAQIQVAEPGSNPPAYSPYPWTAATADDANHSPATLGQLKAVFSLPLETVTPYDTDGDGLPDAWERQHFGSLDAAATDDPDGDGLTNLKEYQIQSRPDNPDTDGDGMGDGYENYYKFPVTNSASLPTPGPGTGPNDDWDNDHKTNLAEWYAGTIPTDKYEQPTFTYPPPTMKWFGVAGKVYFVQWTSNLITWNTMPVAYPGENLEITAALVGGPFYRLKIYLDAGADRDGDGLPDWREIEILGTNPTNPDTDGDGMSDGWEFIYFGGFNLADPNAVLQPDGLTNKEKSELGLNPNIDYTDTNATQPASYTYDPAGRLTGVTAPIGAGDYTPDEDGNLINAQ